MWNLRVIRNTLVPCSINNAKFSPLVRHSSLKSQYVMSAVFDAIFLKLI
jgi:hypothetical protein